MRVLILLALLFGAALAQRAIAEDCSDIKCKRENNCVCSKVTSPLALKDTPQFVVLTFDESVLDLVYKQYYEPLLFNRTNPTGEHISGTFFVPHVYTDYEKVNSLYKKGFEIGVHSVTKFPEADYWANASQQLLASEFGDQRKIVSKFANIPIAEIRGVRIPYLQLSGDKLFKAYVDAGLSYDNSWPTNAPLYPYTLEYRSTQGCIIGTCPKESYKGFWVNPVINLVDNNKNPCNSILGCAIKNDTVSIKNWLIDQFNFVYKSQKAPIGFLLSSAWFQFGKNNYEAFKQFLDYLKTLKDVFLVSNKQVIDWQRKPVALAAYRPGSQAKAAKCEPKTCPLKFTETETRYMRSCVACPNKYPWLGNPNGQ